MTYFSSGILLLIGSIISVSGCSSINDDNAYDNDKDRDLISNDMDNCPLTYNPDQAATIGDATQLGDVCDDEDFDGIADGGDNCPMVGNPDQLDTNGDGLGDFCESCGMAKLVADIETGGESGRPRPLAAIDGKVYFSTYDPTNARRLWVYDSKSSGEVVQQLDTTVFRDVSNLTALDGKLYFSGYDGVHGSELWVYDPALPKVTPALVADIYPGTEGSFPSSLTILDGKLYFSADDSVHGRELWRYDPASGQSDVIMAADIDPTSDGGYPKGLITYDGKLYFFAENGTNGKALWVYEPALGASQVAAPLPDIQGPSMGRAVMLDGKLYFRWWWPVGDGKLWAYDLANPSSGLTEQAEVPGIFDPSDDIDDLVAYSGKLYFSASLGDFTAGLELRVFDPANVDAGVMLAADIYPGRRGGRVQYPEPYNLDMVELDGKLYMNANDGVQGYELMTFTDTGPDSGVRLAADINPGQEDGFPADLLAVDNKLYFAADDGVHGEELWEFDPTCR